MTAWYIVLMSVQRAKMICKCKIMEGRTSKWFFGKLTVIGNGPRRGAESPLERTSVKQNEGIPKGGNGEELEKITIM